MHRLLSHVERQGCTDEDLADIAYTLQVGREAMEVRLACVVSTLEELKAKLAQYLAGEKSVDELYRGEIRRDKDALSILADEDMGRTIDAWLSKGKLHKLVELWVRGLAFDWARLYDGEVTPRRISLPTYPFARERYWVPEELAAATSGISSASGCIRSCTATPRAWSCSASVRCSRGRSSSLRTTW
ncbi:hypothetical protein [Variovorax sp. NFACC29]|uniref:KS-MAT linker domain-containing protein n=1 Tax=Variovorax sp. NFACC29 TaxID=1566272 RepID=UPI003AB0BD8C